ncbi:MICOS complex subunit Mic10-like [Sinocyclocheilus grahami]|uniref:MICOS complex subunit MIC10 n=2 Tax=Sinocyclocheilus TaxID=75365 RepID=A0A672MPN9_SINGR|nr:PREDICTED: MICOS complex subunit Mic10-like [Sinocyclocheilus grahami]
MLQRLHTPPLPGKKSMTPAFKPKSPALFPPSAVIMSEKELGQKWDHCLADSAIKFGTGLGLGIVFSVVFFKRRTWPIVFGTGLGLGMAYSNCQNDLRSHYVLHSKVAKEQ